MLRNDFNLSEADLPEQNADPVECDIPIFLGKEDSEICAEQLCNWKTHTNRTCTLHYFNGGYFFLHDESVSIAAFVSNTLMKLFMNTDTPGSGGNNKSFSA